MENTDHKYAHIKGWGMDYNPQNEPTYPMKKYTGDDHNRLNYLKPPQQKTEVEVLHSTERPTLSAVYGTSSPLKGLSGIIRRLAFKYSESSYGHWLPLLVADRINVVEGILGDIFSGRIPNVFAERGWKADWKYNRKSVVRKIIVATMLTAAAAALISGKGKKLSNFLKIARFVVFPG